MGFTKLDSGIVDSSVWSESLATRVVWVTILAKCDPDGMVRCARSGLRRASNVTEEEFDTAIQKLESPDPESRTKAEEGRRIREVEGGWLVINYCKYRQFSYSLNPDAVRMREKRSERSERVQNVQSVQNIPERSASLLPSPSSSSSSEEDKILLEFDSFWDAYPAKVSKKDSLNAFRALRKTVSLEDIIKAFNGYVGFLKEKRLNENFEQSPMYPSTFLRMERWKEFINYEYKPRL